MPAALCRFTAALICASAILASRPTRADSGAPPLLVQQQANVPVAHALDLVFGAAHYEQLTMRGFAHIRHCVGMVATRFWPTPNLAIRIGAGKASLVDSVVAGPEKSSGTAVMGSVYLAVAQPPGLSIGVELSTLQIRYSGSAGMNEGTVMFALSSR